MHDGSIRDLYIDQLRDIYSAETQLVKALSKMSVASSSDRLREALEEHLRQTSEHVGRLEQIFEHLREKPTGKKSLGMDGLAKDSAEVLKQDYFREVKDVAIVSAAQRVEHYEIAGYRTLSMLAELLGENEHVSLLEQTLKEEKETDQILADISVQISPAALRRAA
jgi:ferritin-like metal-binding protein YciE